MRCEDCRFDLPEDWPPTLVDVPVSKDLGGGFLSAKKVLCAPCARRHVAAPMQNRSDPTMTDYHALPPHVPAGRRKETKR